MSTKSIERRLGIGFYDMAWLNLCAGLESLPEIAKTAAGAQAEGFLRKMTAAGSNLVAAITAGESEATAAETENLLGLRKELESLTEELSCEKTKAQLLSRALRRRIAAGGSATVDVDEEVRSALLKIFAGDDPMIINLRIQSMLRAFPARMTKSRLYDMVSGIISLYVEKDSDSMESFCYRVRSAAVLDELKAPETADKLLRRAEETIAAESSDADAEVLEELTKLSSDNGDVMGYIESLARCVNAMAALGIMSDFPKNLREDSSVYEVIAPTVAILLEKLAGDDADEAAYERLIDRAHGAMETYFEPLSVLTETETGRLQAAIDAMSDEEATAYIPMMKVARLMSTSAYASLSGEPVKTVTAEDAEECRQELLAKLESAFSGQPKAMTREMTAAILAELPVWFESRTEVMEYMLQSLRGCRTDGEKRAALAMLEI